MLKQKRSSIISISLFIFMMILPNNSSAQFPPFFGTIFIAPDIITSDDTTSFEGVTSTGQGNRLMFDRRVNNWVNVNAYLFDATFDDGLTAEIQVNPEFGSVESALVQAQKYGHVIGQLPTVLREDVQAVWIHKGEQPFGGGNNSLLIHTAQGDLYSADNILEETLVHEASHTSLDADHATSAGWLAAQSADGVFISDYANDNPTSEDISESFLLYMAVRYRSDRITQTLKDSIESTIPNRIAYFDAQSFDMYPISSVIIAVNDPITINQPRSFVLKQNHPNPFNPITNIEYTLFSSGEVSLNIFNLAGEEVASLVSEVQYAGSHQVTWNASNMASGVYLYRLQVHQSDVRQAGDFVQTRKMVLLK